MNGAGSSQGHRLLQIGVALFLVALLLGVALPRFAAPRVALSAHLLGIMQGLFLMILGLVWPRLMLSPAAARAGFWLAVYGCLAAWLANVLAAVWRAGSPLLPIAAGPARGTELQEAVIAAGLRTGGAALIAATALVLWGLRSGRSA
jgi:hydroxylaminobenzene mutase